MGPESNFCFGFEAQKEFCMVDSPHGETTNLTSNRLLQEVYCISDAQVPRAGFAHSEVSADRKSLPKRNV